MPRLVTAAALAAGLLTSTVPAHASGPDPVQCFGTVMYAPTPLAATSATWTVTCTGNPPTDDDGPYLLTTTFSPPALCPVPTNGTVTGVSGTTPEGPAIGGNGTFSTNGTSINVFFAYRVIEPTGVAEQHLMSLTALCAQGARATGKQSE